MSTLNLFQKLSAIAADAAGQISETSRLPSHMGGGTGLALDEVERVCGPLFIKYGVVTLVATHTTERRPISDTGYVWDTAGSLTFINEEDPTDRETVDIRDIGASPTAASSFAVKAVYRRLFHIAGDDDGETRPRPASTRAADRQPAGSGPGQLRPPSEKQLGYLRRLAEESGLTIDEADLSSSECSQLIDIIKHGDPTHPRLSRGAEQPDFLSEVPF